MRSISLSAAVAALVDEDAVFLGQWGAPNGVDKK